jgi:hypothetical protein
MVIMTVIIKRILLSSIFTNELITHYGDIKNNTFFHDLINLKQRGQDIKHIQHFQKSCFRVKNIPDENLLDLFMSSLKEILQHGVHILKPKSLENAFAMAMKVESKNMAMKRDAPNTYRNGHVTIPNHNQPIRLKPQKMDEIRAKGLCFNCDNKYIKGYTCS